MSSLSRERDFWSNIVDNALAFRATAAAAAVAACQSNVSLSQQKLSIIPNEIQRDESEQGRRRK